MTRRCWCLVAFLCCYYAATIRPSHGEVLRLRTPSTCATEGGSRLSLPPGYWLSDEDWERNEEEVKRLQESETRLSAENAELRKGNSWVIGGILVGAVLGLVAGIVAF